MNCINETGGEMYYFYANISDNAGKKTNISNFCDGNVYFLVGTTMGAVSVATGGDLSVVSGLRAGFVSGTANAWITGGDVRAGVQQGLRTGAIAAITSGVAGGISGAVQAYKLGLNPWTGTGVSVSEMKLSMSPATSGELTGFNGDPQSIKDYVHENYPGSNKYVNQAVIGLEPSAKLQGYTFDASGCQILDADGNTVQGFTVAGKKTLFVRPEIRISISPNMSIYKLDFQAVLGHEVIHAYHYSKGMMALYGENWSEYYAYKYSASIPYSMQDQALKMMEIYKPAATSILNRTIITPVIYPSWAPRTLFN
ncbi:hypothetical protein LJB78_00780 [Bacteroidales bacterium OttesenSCG-928-J16]|nr:hypothetical protein [Bacteroidales bacterium OttesenSCG-928-J16]